MLEDRLLTWRFKNGSRQALARIYEKYESMLLTIAGAILNDASAGEDVVQDVFLRFAQHPEALRVTGNLRSYLAVCTANLSKDRLRSRRQVHRGDDSVADGIDRLDPLTHVLRLEQTQALWRAVIQLPVEQREVVVLRQTAGLTFKEIALALKVSINTAQSRYRYGIEKLRTSLNGEFE